MSNTSNTGKRSKETTCNIKRGQWKNYSAQGVNTSGMFTDTTKKECGCLILDKNPNQESVVDFGITINRSDCSTSSATTPQYGSFDKYIYSVTYPDQGTYYYILLHVNRSELFGRIVRDVTSKLEQHNVNVVANTDNIHLFILSQYKDELSEILKQELVSNTADYTLLPNPAMQSQYGGKKKRTKKRKIVKKRKTKKITTINNK